MDPETTPRLQACRSEFELFVPSTDIVVVGGPGGGGALKADRKLDVDRRRELIKSVRAGEHVELTVRARTFRQKDGHPNANFLRFNPSKLESIAKSFAGVPFLLDHNTWSQRARMGTISGSELVEEAGNWLSFYQDLQVVKPEAVISVLDGTLDRFSIGWFAVGAVLCTVHKTDVRGRNACNCWPGDRVAVDGKEQITEYEFENARGKETSGVNAPAVSGTRIDDIRLALAAELGLERRHEGDRMLNFARLAAALGVTSLSAANDEDSAVRAVEALKRDKLAAEGERDNARTELGESKKREALALAKAIKTQVDAEIASVYKAGKLAYARGEEGESLPSPREARLRRIAKEDGLEALKAEIKDMPVIVPIGKRSVDDEAARLGADEGNDDDALAAAAEQLGLDPKDLREYANKLQEG